jgi:hypothetical protein
MPVRVTSRHSAVNVCLPGEVVDDLAGTVVDFVAAREKGVM